MAATATRARAPRPKPARITVTPQELLRIEAWLSEFELMERSTELRIVRLAALSGTNVHFLGMPGTGKSLSVRQYAKSIVGATYFEKTMNAAMPADAVVGAYDMARFAKTGEFVRNVEGFLPMADIGFVDELFRANGPLQDALLPIANTEERQYEHNGGMHKSKIALFASASNHKPDADNEQAQALVDRITLWLHVERLKARDSFKELARKHHARTVGTEAGTWEAARPTITIEQLHEAQRQVKLVDSTREDFLEALANLRDECFRAGLGVSDRSWIELVRVIKAQAWSNGRDYCTVEDCAAVEHGLASDPDHVGVAHGLMLPFLGRFEGEAVEKRQEAAPHLAEWAEIRPLVEEAGVRLPDQLLKRVLACVREIDDVKKRVDTVLAEAANENREAATLNALEIELHGAQKWFHDNKFPNDYKPRA